jgi:hypothetical protein
MSWAIATSLAALLIGVGKFLDDHHVSKNNRLKGRLQHILVIMFLSLNQIRIPDVPIVVSRFVFAHKYRASFRLLISVSLSYFCAVLLFYNVTFVAAEVPLGDQLFYVAPDAPPDRAALFFSMMATIIFMAACFPLGRITLRFLDRRTPLTQRLLTPACIIFMSVLIGPIAMVLMRGMVFLRGRDIPEMSYISISISEMQFTGEYILKVALVLALYGSILEPTTLILLLVVILAMVLAALFITKLLMMAVFDRASDPAKSPFAYFFGLTGVIVLLMKLASDLRPHGIMMP